MNTSAAEQVPESILDDDFDAVQHLNDTLPPLNLTSNAASAKQNRVAQFQPTVSELQSQVARFSAYNARTSAELASLTDEILRSGNRLAYEVEVLRSDANSLSDLLSETLRDDIRHFVQKPYEAGGTKVQEGPEVANGTSESINDPEFMKQLRLLGHVKSRLEEVIQVFGNALKWPIPPSDVSIASSLISVSAPELGVANTAEDNKARATIRQYRDEISDLLNSEGGGMAGLDAAQKRVDEFQNLALVWRGTTEEKARNRVVEGFGRLVEDRRRAIDSQQQTRRAHMDSNRSSPHPSRSGTPSLPGAGLLGNLRKLRDEIYLD